MRIRLGEGAGATQQAAAYGAPVDINGVRVTLHPAGHVLGSAQVAMDFAGQRAVVSGDYKRALDPTCQEFEVVPCNLFVTEATFALPVFHHPPASSEIGKLLASVKLFPERTHVVGCYGLGKTQRVIALLRAAGWDAPIYLHGALTKLSEAYEAFGVRLGTLLPATVANKASLRGAIVLAPPSAVADRWARRLADPVVALASDWMQVRQRAKAGGIELPLIISDHADWNALNRTLDEVGAKDVWVTHGREEALIIAAGRRGIRGQALHLVGREDDSGEGGAE
jgi:putative mRNA 3-end processing factor